MLNLYVNNTLKVTLQMHLEISLIVCQCVLLGGVQNKLESTCQMTCCVI
jgi:hypothetical protein